MATPLIYVVDYVCADYVQIVGIFTHEEDAIDARQRFINEHPNLDYEDEFGCFIGSYALDTYMPEEK